MDTGKIDQNGIISTIAGTGDPRYNGEVDGQLAIHSNIYPRGLFVTEDDEVLFVDDINWCEKG